MLVAKAQADVGLTPVLRVASSITISVVTGTGPSRVCSLSGILGAGTEIQLEAASNFISELSRVLAPVRGVLLAPSPSACIANPELTTVTCLIDELARRS